MHKHRLTLWLLLVAMIFPVTPGAADEPEEVEEQGLRPVGGLTFVDEIELTIANLVVHVTDKKGIAITDLSREDFEIFHDGERREITNFRLYTDENIREQFAGQDNITTEAPIPSADGSAGPVPIHMVLYIDNENLEPLDRNRVLSQAKRFRSQQPSPTGADDGGGVSRDPSRSCRSSPRTRTRSWTPSGVFGATPAGARNAKVHAGTSLPRSMNSGSSPTAPTVVTRANQNPASAAAIARYSA